MLTFDIVSKIMWNTKSFIHLSSRNGKIQPSTKLCIMQISFIHWYLIVPFHSVPLFCGHLTHFMGFHRYPTHSQRSIIDHTQLHHSKSQTKHNNLESSSDIAISTSPCTPTSYFTYQQPTRLLANQSRWIITTLFTFTSIQ